MPDYSCHKHHLQWFDGHYLTKASCEIAASSLEDLWAKVEKVQKGIKLCTIMLINPSQHNFLEKIIFDVQITLDRVHAVRILSLLDYCITTHIM